METLNVKRQEFKYYLNNTDITYLRSALSKVMELDHNANPESNEYKISSLYFETPDDRDLDEKLDGILVREKHRIRIYNHEASTIKLETKKRNGTVISKDSVEISQETAQRIVDSNFELTEVLDPSLRTILTKLRLQGYRPRIIVEYDREAYFLPYGNIRVTFDKNLRSYNSHIDLFHLDKVSEFPISLDNQQILEVKFSGILPSFLQKILSSVVAHRYSISKYALAQRYLNGNPWRDHLIPPF